jgi:hypothetical protein
MDGIGNIFTIEIYSVYKWTSKQLQNSLHKEYLRFVYNVTSFVLIDIYIYIFWF